MISLDNRLGLYLIFSQVLQSVRALKRNGGGYEKDDSFFEGVHFSMALIF